MKTLQSYIADTYVPLLTRSVVRILLPILIALAVLLLTAQPAAACIITITPDSANGYVGDILTFTINVEKTHRTCLTPIDETEINLKGMELVSQTLWEPVSSEVHRKDISVRLTEVGEGRIEVIRECTKGGGSCTVEVTVKELIESPPPVLPVPVPPTTIPEPAPSPETPIPIPPTTIPEPAPSPTPTEPIPPTTIPEPAPSPTPTEPIPPTTIPEPIPSPAPVVLEPSWWEAFSNGMMQPDIIAILAFSIVGTIALMRRYRRFRYLVLLAAMSYFGFILGGHPGALGAIQNIILRIGEIKERLPSYLLLGIPVIVAILFGRVFCGWVCPMGAVQNFVHKKETGKKVKRFDVSPRLHNILRYGKYVTLSALVIATLVTRINFGHDIDPFKALFNIQLEWIPTSILVVLLAISLVIGFPWCKYLCPLGAFFALFSKFSLFKVKIGDKCTNCKACHTVFCDYKAIKPGEVKPQVNQQECTRCGECISRCPHNAIELTMRR